MLDMHGVAALGPAKTVSAEHAGASRAQPAEAPDPAPRVQRSQAGIVARRPPIVGALPLAFAPPVRRCACGGIVGLGGECATCKAKRLQRQARDAGSAVAPSPVHEVLRSPGRPLEPGVRRELEARFRHDFSRVRVHTDARAAESARALAARAYTVGHNLVFASGAYAPASAEGRRLLAHELTHVIQQDGSSRAGGALAVGPTGTAHEQEAERVAGAVAAGRRATPVTRSPGAVQLAPDPYIKKVTVHLAPKQSAELTWNGTPPASAPGSDTFTVSTGKGYSDPGDPRGTCTRQCCSDPEKQCAPPWNQPSKVGACCTYYGTGFWTGTPEADHGGWKFWTPIQPWYSKRGIALHQHDEVTGEPIGHGCVRMDEANAQRISLYSRGRRTSVEMDGRAAPVLCDEARRCGAAAAAEAGPEETRLAEAEQPAVERLEGEMS
jgi:Domain of unknown function (DUF4157)